MKAELIAIGPESLETGLVERNARFLTDELAALGVELCWQSAVGEDPVDLQRALERALERCDFLFLVGGMGQGGFTRETVAEGLGLPLVPHRESLAAIKEVFGRRDGSIPDSYAALAMVPQGAAVFPNARGLSPGCALSAGDQCILMLPAAQRELQPMVIYGVYHFLLPMLEQAASVRSVRVYGKSALEAARALSDLLESVNPLLAVYPDEGEVLLRVTALARTAAQADRLCGPMLREAAERLGSAVYGTEEDTLADAAVYALRKAGLRAAGAEYGTGGLLGQLFAAAEDPRDVLETVAFASAAEELTRVLGVSRSTVRRGGAGPDTAAAMAAGAARVFGTALGVAAALTPEGSEGPARVSVAVSDGMDVWLRETVLPEGEKPERAAAAACKNAIDLLRLYALGAAESLPAPCRAPRTARRDSRPWYRRILPWKGDGGGTVARKCGVLLVALALAGSSVYLAAYAWSARVVPTEASHSEPPPPVSSEASQPPEQEEYPADYLPQFASWWAINREVAGEVAIKDTSLQYTLVQTEDNEYYQNCNIYEERDRGGTPFVDYRVDLKKESVNTVLYGQSTEEDPVFEELRLYKSLDYYQNHPVIQFDSVYREGEYKIFSVFLTNLLPEHGEVWKYQNFIDGDEAEFTDFVKKARERSLIETTVDVEPGDKLLTLTTNSNEFEEARFVVVARKVREGESSQVDVRQARLAEAPVLPEAYRNLLDASPGASSAPPSSSASLEPPSSSGSSAPASSAAPSSAPSSSSSSSVSSAPSSSAPSSSAPPSSAPPKAPSSEPSSSEEVWEESSEEEWVSESEPESKPKPKPSSSSEEEDDGDWSEGGPIAMDEIVSVNGVEMEAFDAVCQMTMNEMGGTFRPEAQKAQAVAIYSRLVARKGVVSGIGLRTPTSGVKNAVRSVWGETIRSRGAAVDAYFCASSAGMTNTSKEVWGGVVPGHTENVESPWDEASPGFEATKRMEYQDVIDRVYNKLDVDLEGVDEEEWFEVLSLTGGGYIDQIRVGGEKTVSGRYLRETVLNLRSACFEWEFTGDYVVFTTFGYGHGCGMSQYGANGMAGDGSSYVEILEHYYAGCTVE